MGCSFCENQELESIESGVDQDELENIKKILNQEMKNHEQSRDTIQHNIKTIRSLVDENKSQKTELKQEFL